MGFAHRALFLPWKQRILTEQAEDGTRAEARWEAEIIRSGFPLLWLLSFLGCLQLLPESQGRNS